MLTVYANEAMGAYGYREKPWYLPGTRLAAFLAEVAARSLPIELRDAAAATDAQLAAFHDPAYVAWVTARCAADRGSLDAAAPQVQARSRRLLDAVASAGGAWASAADLRGVLGPLEATLRDFAPFLASEGLVDDDPAADAVRLTEVGRAFLADPAAGLGGPTFARAHVERAARAVCGAVLDAVATAVDGRGPVFVPIAGFHHARRAEARSYCLYNDAALAVIAALRTVAGRVAYVDVDIHHGDGVYEAFAADPRVVIADLHEGRAGETPHGAVVRAPFDGEGAGRGTKLALALGRGLDDRAFLAAWGELEAFVGAHRPELVILVAGVDGLATDPMSHQEVTPAVFGEIARRVRRLAEAHAGGRLVVLGGGGYELSGLAAGWAAVVEGLLGDPWASTPTRLTPPPPSVDRAAGSSARGAGPR